MNEYDILLKQVCKEISMIADQVEKNGTMSEKDLDRLDKLYHTKKDMLTAKAMEDAEVYSEGNSGARGRSPMTGRYVSRENGSYEDGYSKGYSEAMSQMNHWPSQNPYYPEQKRW